jgi:hypothetical protein
VSEPPVVIHTSGVWVFGNGAPYGLQNATIELLPEDEADRLGEDVAELEELRVAPGQVWLLGKPVSPLSWDVQLSEEQFWNLVDMLLGPEVVAEMKHDLEDVLRWEGEGGHVSEHD